MTKLVSSLTLGLLLAGCAADAGDSDASQRGQTVVTGGIGASVAAHAGGPSSVGSGSSAGAPAQFTPPVTGGGVVPPPGPAAMAGVAGTGAPPIAAGQPPIGTAPAAGSGARPPVMPAAGSGVAAGSGAPPAMPVPPATGGTEPVIPEPKGECPQIASGAVTVSGVGLQLRVGAKSASQKGPIMVYWHGTGGNALFALGEIAPSATAEIMASGGVIVSMESGGMGGAIDWGVFTQGDFDLVDQIVACSVKQLNIDTHRIYTSGSSAGGLAAGTLAFFRSNYIAAAAPNSGGVAPWPGNNILKDKTHVPSSFTMHGAPGIDQVVIDFGQASMDMDNAIVAAGGFAVDCNHGGGHVAAPTALLEASWTFMKAHPFGTKPSPYAGGLPAGMPNYCKIVGK